MDDRSLMEDILLTAKVSCDLYLHGTIESGTAQVHSTFDTALDNALKIESEIYNKMKQKGWYPTDQAQQQKIQQVKQTYSTV